MMKKATPKPQAQEMGAKALISLNIKTVSPPNGLS
jgi:hypothetical protein